MNRRHFSPLFLIIALLFVFTACDNEDEAAESLLYSNNLTPAVSIDMILSRVNAWELNNGNVIYGLDVSILNMNSVAVFDVYIEMISVSPSSSVVEFSGSASNWRYIEEITAWGTKKPTGYWCFSCDTSNEIYVGNFYVELATYVSGGQTYEVRFDVDFMAGQREYSTRLTKTFVTVYNPLKNQMELKMLADITDH